jgi:hypothetical protein
MDFAQYVHWVAQMTRADDISNILLVLFCVVLLLISDMHQ